MFLQQYVINCSIKVRFISGGLGWGAAHSIASRLIVLWVGARYVCINSYKHPQTTPTIFCEASNHQSTCDTWNSIKSLIVRQPLTICQVHRLLSYIQLMFEHLSHFRASAFSWKWLQTSVDSSSDLILFLSMAALTWMATRSNSKAIIFVFLTSAVLHSFVYQ